jgi:glycerophosphoryl diester phosphodiesterase
MLIVGHRGTRAIAPENTLKAIRVGMVCADYVEVDVRLSRDGIPVIIHDARLDRTTSGTGQVNDLPLKELKELDAGSGEKIPTLEEAITEVVQGDRGLIIEIKEPGSEEIICNVLGNCIVAKVMAVSFHSGSLSIMKTCLPDLKTGIIVPNNQVHHQVEENGFSFDYILPRLDFLTPELVKRAHDSGKRVLPWTLNSRGELKKALIMGVDGFVTDDPCTALRTVQTNGFLIS